MTTTLTNPTIEVLESHVSVRSFTDEPVSDEMLRRVLNAARRAPTSSNWQTYSIIAVRDPAKKERLAELAGGQRHIAESQVFLAFAADVHRLGLAASLHGMEPAKGLEHTITPIVDAAIVGEAAQVAAESFGLGAVMVGGMRRRPRDVAEVLGLPEGVFVVYGMSVGWPAGDPLAPGLKPRLPEDLVIHHDEYSDEGALERIAEYDRDLAAYYEARGRNLDEAAWSGPMARGSSRLRFATLRDDLEALGFEV
ncbi:MAG: NADPH-dependent oxidoreductase [Acidimicrobiia bacterium]|nr:NADPH-dependent oxidoreductase [Acidimicrobiia bacterium]